MNATINPTDRWKDADTANLFTEISVGIFLSMPGNGLRIEHAPDHPEENAGAHGCIRRDDKPDQSATSTA